MKCPNQPIRYHLVTTYNPTVLGVGDGNQCFHGLAAITYLLSASDFIAIRRRVYGKAMKNYS